MRTIIPIYYTDFSCIADRCRHNCCIGWEIDIDPDTYAWYQTVEGAFGDRLRDNIHHGVTPCFHTDHTERCAFLNERGLCDIILTLGEDALCDICTDHPRFRTYVGDTLHLGLGLCCEEACRLVLSTPVAFMDADTGAAVTVDTSRPVLTDTRAPAEWAAIYRRLERLDPAWDAWLDVLADAPVMVTPTTVLAQRVGAYFRFRYPDTPILATHAAALLETLCAGRSWQEQLEICRLYSAEIEYSDENITAIKQAAED